LPLYDNCLSALITDLHERGLHQDVCVVVWGERPGAHRASTSSVVAITTGPAACLLRRRTEDGTIHWCNERGGEYPITRAYTPQNILATLYHVLGSILGDDSRPQRPSAVLAG
jgi:hypothetical protein